MSLGRKRRMDEAERALKPARTKRSAKGSGLSAPGKMGSANRHVFALFSGYKPSRLKRS